LRSHFVGVAKGALADDDNNTIKGDGILNVRVIRDPNTFIGKGIGYV